tara:strand:+ start:974 stop:1255 length:282 start_codon:yes stop_codon:yes gene_type:complete
MRPDSRRLAVAITQDYVMTDPKDAPDQDTKPGLLQTINSILAALFGVQSAKNRERDFTKGDAGNYIGVYVILVIALVIGMVITVNMVLDAAAK